MQRPQAWDSYKSLQLSLFALIITRVTRGLPILHSMHQMLMGSGLVSAPMVTMVAQKDVGLAPSSWCLALKVEEA